MPRGHTLAEMLVATALLAMIITISAAILDTSRRAYAGARDRTALSASRDSTLTALSRSLETITFTRHPVFSPDGSALVYVSDQHFFCGPSRELLPGLKGLSGDAVFFQRQTPDGSTAAAGFLVQYGEDDAWRPPALPHLKPKWRFRLLQFHQASGELALYRSPASGSSPGAPTPGTGQWFTQPLSRISARNCRVVADNVIAMLIDTTPDSAGGWNTRPAPRDGLSGPAGPAQKTLTQNRLPQEITIHLLLVEEGAWARLSGEQSLKLAGDLQAAANAERADSGRSSSRLFQTLRERLASESLPCQTVVATLALLPGN